MKIAITLTSSLAVAKEYIALTQELSKLFAKSNFEVIYGGTDYGMMAELAKSYKEAGGKNLVGVMSKELQNVTLNYKAHAELDEAIWVDQITERVHTIAHRADGFLILPGGYGTLEEMMSYIAGKANKLFDKPIILYNYDHFYDNLISFYEEMFNQGFTKISLAEIVYIVTSPKDVVDYFNNYSKTVLPDKFV